MAIKMVIKQIPQIMYTYQIIKLTSHNPDLFHLNIVISFSFNKQ